MLSKDEMARNTETFKDRIPASIHFVFNHIPQETAKMRPWFKFEMFMGLEQHKTSITKHF